jgi:hypothetical protein
VPSSPFLVDVLDSFKIAEPEEGVTAAAGRPVPCRWSALGGQGARNRRHAIAFEALDFRGGHSPVAAGGGFGCNNRFSHKTRIAARVVPSWCATWPVE